MVECNRYLLKEIQVMRKFRSIAIYLPQYHPLALNDKAWGKGYTEWTNVTTSKPRFPGHYQPQLPGDLGFVDLRLEETRIAQAQMAKQYGIDGFCYYHYWFTGEKLMERPFEEVLATGKPDFPFMLCWANENWSRSWTDRSDDLLIKQIYSEEDDRNHIHYLLSAFRDPRYIRIDGKCVFAIWRPLIMPDPTRTLQIFREEAAKEGIELYIIAVEHNDKTPDYFKYGYDAGMEFQPHCNYGYAKYQEYVVRKLNEACKAIIGKAKIPVIHSYKKYMRYVASQPMPGYKRYPCVMPGWDNAARKSHRAFACWVGNTPMLFKEWLVKTFKKFKPFSKEENLVFINAWNEWGEGCHLEPDLKWRTGFLEVFKDAVDEYNH